jgi:hypothetical protein
MLSRKMFYKMLVVQQTVDYYAGVPLFDKPVIEPQISYLESLQKPLGEAIANFAPNALRTALNEVQGVADVWETENPEKVFKQDVMDVGKQEMTFVTVIVSSVDYGLWDELDKLADDDCPF